MSSNAPTAELRAMQDVLYDILATGIDPERSDAPTEAIEQFLFEHARAEKSRDQFRAFFVEHKLNISAPRLAEAARSAVSLPPIARATDDMPPKKQARMVAAPPIDETPLPELPPHLSLVPAARPSSRPSYGLMATWVGLGCVAAALCIMAFGNYTTVNDLKAEVQRTAAQGQQDRAELQALRDHAAGLESSVAATGELVERVDQKSDLLLQSLAAHPSGRHSRNRR